MYKHGFAHYKNRMTRKATFFLSLFVIHLTAYRRYLFHWGGGQTIKNYIFEERTI